MSWGATVFGREETLLFVVISGHALFSEVFAAHVLEDAEAQRVEQKVPDLVLFLDEATGRQAERVSDRAGQQQDVQLWQRPLAAAAPQRRLWERTNVQEPLGHGMIKETFPKCT